MLGVGTDILEISRMERSLEKEGFKQLVFTAKELKYCESKGKPAQHFAARFCAKEAFMKAVGLGWTTQSDFAEIEILNHENGAPFIVLHGKTKENAEKSKVKAIHISMSHTEQLATAVVILI